MPVPVAVLPALAWLYLLLGHGGFWLTRPRLPAPADPRPAARVSVVVPARDEAALLPVCLPTLLGQRPAAAEVLVVDDSSTDATAAVAAAAGARVVASAPTPPGWAGKPWAMAQGVAAADPAADWLLFTDADITHPPDSLARLLAQAARGYDLVSVMALLRTESVAERLLVPAFVYFFAQLYPFARVASRRWPTAAAAGGCVLVRRAALERAGGVSAIRGALIDDVALARAVRRAGGRCWLGFTADVRSVRGYPRPADVWAMVTRSAWVQLRRSWLLLAGTVAGLLALYPLPVAEVAAGPRWWGLATWAAMSVSYLPVLRLYRRSPLLAPLLPVVALVYLAMTVDSARRGGSAWKGRRPTA